MQGFLNPPVFSKRKDFSIRLIFSNSKDFSSRLIFSGCNIKYAPHLIGAIISGL